LIVFFPVDAPLCLPGLRHGPCPCPTCVASRAAIAAQQAAAAAVHVGSFVHLHRPDDRDVRGVAAYHAEGQLRVAAMSAPDTGGVYIVLGGYYVTPATPTAAEIESGKALMADPGRRENMGRQATAAVETWLANCNG
jgi:hypothetical protein